MPGLFDRLKTGVWSGGVVQFNYYFSQDQKTGAAGYKCLSTDTPTTDSFVLDLLARYSTEDGLVDKVGTGPREYTADDCSADEGSWDIYGE